MHQAAYALVTLSPEEVGFLTFISGGGAEEEEEEPEAGSSHIEKSFSEQAYFQTFNISPVEMSFGADFEPGWFGP